MLAGGGGGNVLCAKPNKGKLERRKGKRAMSLVVVVSFVRSLLMNVLHKYVSSRPKSTRAHTTHN